MEKLLFTAATPVADREEYWKKWLEDHAVFDEGDWQLKQIYKVVEAAVENRQYAFPDDEFTEVKRMIRVRMNLSKAAIESMFGIDVYSVVGEGLFIPLEGIVLKPGTRRVINYDRAVALTGSKGQYLDLSSIPEDVRKEYNFGLTIPALDGGLFVPKKTRLSAWIRGTFDLQYFDLQKH